MRKHMLALTFGTMIEAGPTFAAYTPDTGMADKNLVEGSVAELNLMIESSEAAAAIEPVQIAYAWNGCEDPWYHRSGWQMIAELIWDVCD